MVILFSLTKLCVTMAASLAFATIAAAVAFLAKVVPAGILRAPGTDVAGGL
jgi:hypothetical protein